MKRSLCAAWACALASTLSCHAYAQGYTDPGPDVTQHEYAPQKVVYQVNSGDDIVQKAVLRNVMNEYAALDGKMTAVIVVHGNGITVLQSADEDVQKLLAEVRAKGIKIDVCNNTLKERNIDWHTLKNVTHSDLVRSGVTEVVSLQQQGYIYLKP